ncbi:transposable element Tcb2 transposase [Trichonephila clavipes]|nr:transposable element Tcb2 transposase [Trichonephila clavipes]
MSQRSHLTDSEAWRVVGSVNGSETPKLNDTLFQHHLRSATGTTVSTQTVRNRLHGVGLYARRPMDNRRIFIWRDRGSRNNPAFVHESVRFGGGGVLVYCGISIDGRTYLYIIRDGPLTARRYRDEILRPIVVPYAAAIGDDFILMDDNCRLHHLNPIEHVWVALERRAAGRQPPLKTLQEPKRALLEEWDRISQLEINSLLDSMPQSNEAHFWLNGYVNKQNCRIWSEANPQVYVETPLHPEKLTVWCALWAGGVLLQKR